MGSLLLIIKAVRNKQLLLFTIQRKPFLKAMEHFYYESQGKVLGPYSISEMRAKKLQPGTFVWRYGYENWTPAFETAELKHLFLPPPPPLPETTLKASVVNIAPKPVVAVKKPKKQIPEVPVYDAKYEKETQASATGVFFTLIPLMYFTFYQHAFETADYYYPLRVIAVVGAIIIRSIAIPWIMRIAEKQNRDTVIWRACAWVLPGLALVVIGLRRKRYNAQEWRSYLYNETTKIDHTYLRKSIRTMP